ncbi:MAG TPA: hypothetical protein VLQ93_09870, partial [Myxococcaceae bacterium]|nr:hypothetical protein [Myxococcaceae bacterium]
MRMRREMRRRERAALAVILAIGGLFLWRLATASPGAGPRESEDDSIQALPVQRTRIQPRTLLASATGLQARAPSPLVSSLGATGARLQPRLLSASAPPPEPRSAPPEPAPVTRLAPASEELLGDGLPASGLRCTREGEGLSCGSCRTDSDCPPGKGC